MNASRQGHAAALVMLKEKTQFPGQGRCRVAAIFGPNRLFSRLCGKNMTRDRPLLFYEHWNDISPYQEFGVTVPGNLKAMPIYSINQSLDY